MGGWCCGLPRKKKIAAKDFHETFAYGQAAIHLVVRRAVENVIELSRQNPGMNNDQAFKYYADLVRQFVLLHHTQEDDFIFPFVRKATRNPDAMHNEGNFHLLVAQALEDLKNANGDRTKIRELWESLLPGLVDHLRDEESIMTDALFRQYCTEKELQNLNKQIHKIIDRYMHNGEALVFIIYHLDNKEKMFFDERIPCIVTRFMFPKWAAKAPKEVWSLAPYSRTDSKGNYAWKNVPGLASQSA
eukprot:TRINITY_DN4332_c0_g1::TRINITY_DN4332_c0_g1_i1::g.21245::m.21245 TRINITY_DN4332_c0_g1::TRINITY_DN4332_c0_g1_i1::g.21245  ORF type:complete len:257 (-),score=33.04,Hemerythrin/PF01814.18/2.6e-10,Hemerythrin/PF01814.18/0.0025 TRINITY_DN4332_c0_g1_i1:251-985(-)